MESEWIKVDDRLPEEKQGVLVCLTSQLVTVAYRTVEMDVKLWQLFGNIEDILDLTQEQVTHWMPLPKPPTE